MSTRLRAATALILLFMFPVVVLAFVLGALVAGFLLCSRLPVLGGKVILLTLPVIWAAGSAVREAIRAGRPKPPEEPEITRTEHPALWAELDHLTRSMGEPPVDRVFVAGPVNASASLFHGRRDIMIGLPLFSSLNRLQLRAVLAHELGHLSSSRHHSGARAYHAAQLLERFVERLRRPMLHRLVLVYYKTYLRVAHQVVREHEREADLWAVRLAGSEATASIWTTLRRTGAAWNLLLDHYVATITHLPTHDDDGERQLPSPSAGLRHLLAGPLSPSLEEFAAAALHESANPYSTHPAAGERRALALAARIELPPAEQALIAHPAWTLLSGGLEGVGGLEQALGFTGANPPEWDDAIAAAAIARSGRLAGRMVAQMLHRYPASYASAAWVLHHVSLGDGPALAEHLVRGDLHAEHRPSAHRRVLSDLLEDLLLSVLAGQGRARVRASWDEQVVRAELIGADGELLRWPGEAIQAAANDPAQVVVLQQILAGIGADLNRLVPVPDNALRVSSLAVAALAHVQVHPPFPGDPRQQRHDVIAYDDGLLIWPVPPGRNDVRGGLGVMVLGRDTDRELARARAVTDTVGDFPAGVEPPGRWIPYREITFSQWHGHRWRRGQSWQVIFTDGTKTDFRITPLTATAGNVDLPVRRAVSGLDPGLPVALAPPGPEPVRPSLYGEPPPAPVPSATPAPLPTWGTAGSPRPASSRILQSAAIGLVVGLVGVVGMFALGPVRSRAAAESGAAFCWPRYADTATPVPGALRPPQQPGAVIDAEQATLVVRGMWNLREAALRSCDVPTLTMLDTGSAQIGDLSSADCDCNRHRYLAPLMDLRLYVPRQTRYPAYFMAEVATQESNGVPQARMMAFTRASEAGHWQLALVSVSDGDLGLPLPLGEPGVGRDGFTIPAGRAAKAETIAAAQRLAAFWQQSKDTGRVPPNPFDATYWTTQLPHDMAAHRNGTTQGNDLNGRFTYRYVPGTPVFSTRTAQDSIVSCTTLLITSTYRATQAGGTVLQTPDRENWGGDLPAGRYRSVTVKSLSQTCFQIRPGETVASRAYGGSHLTEAVTTGVPA